MGNEGYLIFNGSISNKTCLIITANRDVGLLYGVFAMLKQMQLGKNINLTIQDHPKIANRILNHWDNPDGSIERGYAGNSIWKWNKLPEKADPRYTDYARANASIGINGTVLNNVNADAKILTSPYLHKVKALADIFRPFGIKVYLSAKFSAPIELGKLKTADPLDPEVQKWWKQKIDEIYQLVPDFGGFCVKANSEGQPGPQDYGRSHSEGANMLATFLHDHQGILMWRAFVYASKSPDRVKDAYNEFKPLDGKFADNVLLQVKNGPIDFQPREPFHPLFGALGQTPLMLELQITQEYLGFSKHLVYLGPLFEEALKSDTHCFNMRSTVSDIVQGRYNAAQHITAIAGVANIGSDENWTGHPFAQANWYAFGSMAWNPDRSAASIAEEWLKLTFSSDAGFVTKALPMMMGSREAAVNYMTPLGLSTLMDISHFRPQPWRRDKPYPVLTKESYHHADTFGIGFNRSGSGSNAVAQYCYPLDSIFNKPNTCPTQFLLWFHHLPWDYRLKSGIPLWDELCYHLYDGVSYVRIMQQQWDALEAYIDKERFTLVKNLLALQETEAVIWRDANVLYFQTFSQKPIPATLEKPAHSLEYYKGLRYFDQ